MIIWSWANNVFIKVWKKTVQYVHFVDVVWCFVVLNQRCFVWFYFYSFVFSVFKYASVMQFLSNLFTTFCQVWYKLAVVYSPHCLVLYIVILLYSVLHSIMHQWHVLSPSLSLSILSIKAWPCRDFATIANHFLMLKLFTTSTFRTQDTNW